MSAVTDLLLLGTVSVDLFIASSSRLPARIHACALQGWLLAVLPAALELSTPTPDSGRLLHAGIAGACTLALKTFVVPAFLLRAVRRTGHSREVEPFASLHLSLLLCALLVGLSFWLGASMFPAGPAANPLGVPAGLSTLLIGLYLTVAAHDELTQVIGYLVAENGVFIIGQTVLGEFPLVVEVGVLLDVLVAVMLLALLFVSAHRDEHPRERAGGAP